MTRLLIATDSFLPRWDGISRFISETLSSLSEEFDVTILAPDYGDVDVPKGVELIRFPTRDFMIGDYRPAMVEKELVKEAVRSCDLLFTQTIGPIGFTAQRFARKLKKPRVAYIHSIEWELFSKATPLPHRTVEWVSKQVAKRIYNKCNQLLVPSESTAEVLSINRIKSSKRIVQLGVNTSTFHPPKSKERAKKAIGFTKRDFVIGFTGRIGRKKDLPTLYRAYKTVLEKHKRAHLLIVGGGLSADTVLPSLEDVTVVGATNDVPKYLQGMDVFALASLTETSSLATMEAMASGLPVVCSDVGFIKYYVQHGKNGFLFEKGDSEALAEHLRWLMEHPKERKEMGRRARETIEESFTWDQTSHELIAALKDVVAKAEGK